MATPNRIVRSFLFALGALTALAWMLVKFAAFWIFFVLVVGTLVGLIWRVARSIAGVS